LLLLFALFVGTILDNIVLVPLGTILDIVILRRRLLRRLILLIIGLLRLLRSLHL
jgi:hypothetical protein